jgi:hypothetical protein
MRRVAKDYHLNFTNLTDAYGTIWKAIFVGPSAWAFFAATGTGPRQTDSRQLPTARRYTTTCLR